MISSKKLKKWEIIEVVLERMLLQLSSLLTIKKGGLRKYMDTLHFVQLKQLQECHNFLCHSIIE